MVDQKKLVANRLAETQDDPARSDLVFRMGSPDKKRWKTSVSKWSGVSLVVILTFFEQIGFLKMGADSVDLWKIFSIFKMTLRTQIWFWEVGSREKMFDLSVGLWEKSGLDEKGDVWVELEVFEDGGLKNP